MQAENPAATRHPCKGVGALHERVGHLLHGCDMRYPTDRKLLWECVEKSYPMVCRMSGRLGIHRPRMKYLDVEKVNMGYTKQRRHSKSQLRKLTLRPIHLLGKILGEIRRMMRDHHDEELLSVCEQ